MKPPGGENRHEPPQRGLQTRRMLPLVRRGYSIMSVSSVAVSVAESWRKSESLALLCLLHSWQFSRHVHVWCAATVLWDVYAHCEVGEGH